MRVKIFICSEHFYGNPPIPRSRHIMPNISLCREAGEKNISENTIPRNVLDSINRVGYIDLFDIEKARKILDIELLEGQYVKIVLIK